LFNFLSLLTLFFLSSGFGGLHLNILWYFIVQTLTLESCRGEFEILWPSLANSSVVHQEFSGNVDLTLLGIECDDATVQAILSTET
jgi:hypothetical protein